MKACNCFTFFVALIVTITILNCEREKNTLTNPAYFYNNSLIITLNKDEYKSEEYAELTIFNISANDIILGNCSFHPGFDIEKKINGEWYKLYDIICEGIGENYILQSGKKYKFPVCIYLWENRFPNSSGPYRLKLWLYKTVGDERVLLDDSIRVTPEFTLISN